MLNSYGKLTDIGGWYLEGNATGVKPDNITVTPNHTTAGPATPTYTLPALVTKLSSADSITNPRFIGVVVLSILAVTL